MSRGPSNSPDLHFVKVWLAQDDTFKLRMAERLEVWTLVVACGRACRQYFGGI